MSTELTAADQEVLERFATGALAPEAPEARAALQRSPALARAWRELQATEAMLVRARRQQDAIIAEASDHGPVAGEAGFGTFARGHLGSAPPVPRGGRRRGWWLAAAAAVLVVAGVFAPWAGPEPRRSLGGHQVQDLAPVGATAAFTSFSWTAKLPPGGWFRVVVFAEQEVLAGAPILTSPRPLETPSWQLTSEESELLPTRIRWEVQVRDAQGELLERSAPVTAWRSPPR
jgi:hypothetical protein